MTPQQNLIKYFPPSATQSEMQSNVKLGPVPLEFMKGVYKLNEPPYKEIAQQNVDNSP